MHGVGPVNRERKDGGEGVAGEVGDEAPRGVRKGHQGLENLVQDNRKLLGTAAPLLHQRFGEGRESGKVNVQRESFHLALQVVGDQFLLNKGWDKRLHYLQR